MVMNMILKCDYSGRHLFLSDKKIRLKSTSVEFSGTRLVTVVALLSIQVKWGKENSQLPTELCPTGRLTMLLRVLAHYFTWYFLI